MVTPRAIWRGRIPIEKRTEAIGAGNVIVNQECWDALWATLDPGFPIPKIDFNHNIAIVSVGRDRNETSIDFHITKNGAVYNLGYTTAMGFFKVTDAAFVIAVLPKKGIRSVQGTRIPR